MKRILTIAGLTWKSAFRYRLFWILAALMIGAVTGLPLILKDDGTAKGLTQILLTYTLTAVTALLGMATLWLSCGTLAKDVEECQIQMVAVKPISRWQVWLGKWLGILSLNAVLLTLAGVAIYTMLLHRAARLPAAEQRILREEIFVARASIKDRPQDWSPKSEELLQRLVQQKHATPQEEAQLREQIRQNNQAAISSVLPGHSHLWVIDLHTLSQRTRDEGFQVRVKFHTSNPNPDITYTTLWNIGPANSPRDVQLYQTLPADSFQEFTVPPHLLDDHQRLLVDMANPNETPLMFPIEDGFEVLYYESSFGINFIRGMIVILCWLALLTAIGLAAASQLSFAVAAFVSIAILGMGLCSGTVQTVVENGTITGYSAATGGYGHTPLDYVFVPMFRGALSVINLVESFSPIDFLSSGRSITWGMLGLAVSQIVILLGGIFCLVGIALFQRRELATAQGTT